MISFRAYLAFTFALLAYVLFLPTIFVSDSLPLIGIGLILLIISYSPKELFSP